MAAEPVEIPNPVKFGDDLELDQRAYELRRAGRPLKLERIPMELLLLLLERRGQLVTREQIIERVWGKDVFLDADTSINSAIRKIRLVLKDDPEQPKFIQTVTGRGYRFIGGVTDVCPINPRASRTNADGAKSGTSTYWRSGCASKSDNSSPSISRALPWKGCPGGCSRSGALFVLWCDWLLE
jgi:DNA-binding winged helix-turn-helix (wHTH) protein